jgi:glycosyltransferase involved in cell wall biosynthesis
MDITVAICTYNGAERVPEVLDHLRAQDHLEDVRWEVIVVDNNSTDGTGDVVRRYREKTWSRSAPLKVVTETQQGVAFARQRAVDEANGEWVAFLDDDNLPTSDWVAEAVSFAQEHPNAGAFGGQLIGKFEEEPPPSFGLVKGFFALNEREETFRYSRNGRGQFAPGAGLVINREAWQRDVSGEVSTTGASGESRGDPGEDVEAQWFLHEAGWEVWHNADMKAKHKIPADRLREEYLDAFFEGQGRGRHHLRMVRFEPWQRPFMAAAFWLEDLRKLISLYWRFRDKLDDRFVRARVVMVKTMLVYPILGDT